MLFRKMIINPNLQLAGFFRWAGSFIFRWTHSPRGMLALVILITSILSALFLNDTICLMLTPLILNMTLTAKRNPIPYLIALATAANLIVTEVARRRQVKLTFWEYTEAGLLITLISLLFGILWLHCFIWK